MEQLSEKQIHSFIKDGFVKIEQAFPTTIADECRAILWEQTSCNPNNPDTWTAPVIRIGELGQAPFQQAANTPLLHTAFNQLAGNNWLPRTTIGSFPIRFPSTIPATDTGWHVDASFPGEDATDYFKWRINVRSRGRALLMLFLFSDVAALDAPTLIRVGSHGDIARLLAPEGDHGLSFMELAEKLDTLPPRKTIAATGKAGTVYLCHPFIVHAAQDHHGKTPKFMAQPPLLTKQDFDISPHNNSYCPVEMAIVNALGS